jgi:hypothetical protein
VKRLIYLLWDFVKQDFHFRTFLLILLWAAILLTINYSIRLEDDLIDSLPTNGLRFLGYLTLYSTTYFTAVYIVFLSKRKSLSVLNQKFWITSFAGIAFFAADSGFVFHQYLLDWIDPKPKLNSFLFAVLSNATEFITIALPLFLINYFLITKRSDNLGINKREINLAPFFVILLTIAPFIFISSFEKGLNNYYPTYHYAGVAKALGVSEWVPVSTYELFYGLNFFNVELMFRGFMVIAMINFLGRDAVLPMAVFYCSIHFGKPIVEAVSSIFGGYILGAIAFQTRSIWGGVIVHMGLAWLMELSAFCAKEILTE